MSIMNVEKSCGPEENWVERVVQVSRCVSSPSFQSSQFDHPFPGTNVNDCSNQFEGWMEKPVLF